MTNARDGGREYYRKEGGTESNDKLLGGWVMTECDDELRRVGVAAGIGQGEHAAPHLT